MIFKYDTLTHSRSPTLKQGTTYYIIYQMPSRYKRYRVYVCNGT